MSIFTQGRQDVALWRAGFPNVLCLQALRDIQRYRLHDDLFAYLGALVDSVTQTELAPAQDRVVDWIEIGRQELQQLVEKL